MTKYGQMYVNDSQPAYDVNEIRVLRNGRMQRLIHVNVPFLESRTTRLAVANWGQGDITRLQWVDAALEIGHYLTLTQRRVWLVKNGTEAARLR